jgi:hypothetical protein
MNDVREDLDRRAAGFTPDRAAYERVLDRAGIRRVRRRITAGVTAFAISAAAFTGLWAAVRGSDSVSVATPTRSSTTDVGGLRVGLTVDLPRGIGDVLATHFVDAYGIYAATPGALYGIDPSSGSSERTAEPGWDPEAVSLADDGEGAVFAAWGTRVGRFENGVRAGVLKLDTRLLGAVGAGSSGLWVTELTGSRWNLVQIDPESGATIGDPVPVGQGRHSIVEAGGYVFVGGPPGDGPSLVRVDPRTGAAEDVLTSTQGGLAAVDGLLWTVDHHAVGCIDAVTLEECGSVHIARAASIASDGDRLWVLSATGSKNASTYEPDPDQPATVTLLDGRSGAILAGPIPLPDVTPAYLSAANGEAWVGFYDSGLLLRVDTCGHPGCTSSSLHERIQRIQQQIALLDANLQIEFEKLALLRATMRSSPKPSVRDQIRAIQAKISQLEANRAALAQRIEQLAPG